MFVPHSNSTVIFHQFQKQRRIWWRKFSPNPGRYSLTDIRTDTENNQNVEIVANYPWNNAQILETIILNENIQEPCVQQIVFKDGKKLISCHSIKSQININTMFLNTICDAYDNSDYKGINRTLFRYHRKLAPYKISFAISSSVEENSVPELKDLALHLTRKLRMHQISTLLLPTSSILSLESQWNQYDELGIPYNVLLNDKTLKDGLVHLRSRDTTLKEQVHVSELVNYVEQLFRNY